jgi:hypothetical protein
MPIFNPQIMQPIPQAIPQPMPAPMIEPVAPIAPPAAPVQQVFVPVPIPYAEKRKPSMKVSPEAVRKAQGIYPTEQKAKTQMIEQAKTPTPTGAWGAPK